MNKEGDSGRRQKGEILVEEPNSRAYELMNRPQQEVMPAVAASTSKAL